MQLITKNCLRLQRNQDMSENLFTRDIFKPLTFDRNKSSVRVVAVSERPVRVWDNERARFIEEVLMVNKFVLPPSKQVPLLDSHNRSTVSGVLGSARDFAPNGNTLECQVYFSGTTSGHRLSMPCVPLVDMRPYCEPSLERWRSHRLHRSVCHVRRMLRCFR